MADITAQGREKPLRAKTPRKDISALINFHDWKEWNDAGWQANYKLLASRDEDSTREAEVLLHEAGMDGLDELGFLETACRKNTDWVRIASPKQAYTLMKVIPELAQNVYVERKLLGWLNDVCGGIKNLEVFRDATNLRDCTFVERWEEWFCTCPEFAGILFRYGYLSGTCACRFLELLPQLSEEFDLAELGDCKSELWGESWGNADPREYIDAWSRLVKTYPEFAKYKKARIIGDDVDFRYWSDWSEEEWTLATKLVEKHDESLTRKMQKDLLEAVKDSTPWDFMIDACSRNVEWIALASEEIPAILRDETELAEHILENDYAKSRICEWCNRCAQEDEFYTEVEEDECVIDFSDLLDNQVASDGQATYFDNERVCVNRWAYVLLFYPELADMCTTFGKFTGFSAGLLLIRRPELAQRFDLVAIADFSSPCWANYDDENRNWVWQNLTGKHSEFAKYSKTPSI